MKTSLKKGVPCSITSETDASLLAWVLYRRLNPLGLKMPNRGSIVTEMVETLAKAGWVPGQQVRVKQPPQRVTTPPAGAFPANKTQK